MMLSTLPFAGFYNSNAEYEINRELESQYEYFADDTGENMPEFLVDLLERGHGDAWGHASEAYAQEYAESFLDWLQLDGKFESMTSPREYNFSTDRIFVELTRRDIARAWKNTDRDLFTRTCKRAFTSYDGFSSHYSPDWKTWGKLSSWDHNQIGALIHAFAATEHGEELDSYLECELMENFLCNGGISNALCENDAYVRALNIADYMRERANRAIRTMSQLVDSWRAENRPFESTPLGRAMS